MNRLNTIVIFAVTLIALIGFTSHDAHAATITAGANGDWDEPATWVGSVVPVSTDNVIIPSPYTVTIPLGLTVTVDSTGSIAVNNVLDINAGGTLANSGTITNTGTISNGGIINNNSGGIINNNSGGIINNNFGSDISNSGTITNSGAPIINSGNLANNSDGTIIINSIAITNTGTITNDNGGTITINSGAITNDSGGTITNNGTITLEDSLITNTSGGTITNNGTINSNNTSDIDNSGGIIYNNGTINNNRGSLIFNTGIINNNSGGTINNYGDINNSGGTIINNGTITNYCGSSFTNSGTFFGNDIIDGCPPTVTTTVSDNFITDADDLTTFTVTSLFSETMGATGANNPLITFDQDVSDTLTLTGGVWSTTTVADDTYTTSYDIDVSSQELTGVVAATTAAKDAAGNAQETDSSAAAARTFDVDTINPTVVSKTTSDNLISDSDVPGPFTATTTFSEPMDTGATPTITFSLPVASTLSFTSGAWSVGNTVYTATYAIADGGVTVPSVTFTVSGAKDVATNPQVLDATAMTPFAIDTENPKASIGYSDTDSFTTDLYAKSGTVATLTATISESLAASPLPDITIAGANIAGPTAMTFVSSTSFYYDHTVGAGDGTATISLSSATDLAGNLIVSAPTSGANFFIDNTGPTGSSIAIQRTDSTLGDSNPERTYVRSANLILACSDPAALDASAGSGCDGKVDIFGTGLDGETTGNFEDTSSPRAATLTLYRDLKTADATYRDKAGNTATFPDTISLDARIVGVSASTTTPYWEVPLTFTGTVNNARTTDTITFAFGSPTVTGTVLTGGDASPFTVTGSYPQISLDTANPHSPSATLVDSTPANVSDSLGALVTAAGPIVTVQAHPTAIASDFVEDPSAGNRFFVGGRLSDTLFSVPVTSKVIAFEDVGAPADLGDSTTEGITFTDPSGILVDSCSSTTVCPTADNIMRLNVGATISPAERTTYAALYLRDMGSDVVTVRVTNGESPPTTTEFTATARASDTVVFTLTDPFEIEQIEIIGVTDSHTVGLSAVKTYGAELGTIHDIDFTSTTSPPLPISITFDEGRFYSEGTSQSTPQEFLDIDEVFAGDVDYVTTTTTVTYSVLESTTAGVGGSTETVTADAGTGITSILCSADTDLDGLCNSWEAAGTGSGSGVPFSVGATTYYYPLPGTNTGTDDILVEIDAMTFHTPDTTSLANVVSMFSALSPTVNLHHTVDETTIPHVDTLKVWTDTNLVDGDDFNSLKNDYFGTASEHPTLSSQSAQVSTFSNTPTSVTVSGISISIPTNTITSGATAGNITAKIKITISTSGTVTSTPITAPASPVGLTLGSITAPVSSTATPTQKIVTINIPFTTTGPISTTVIPPITVPLTLPAGATITAAVTNPGSPSQATTLLSAKAQAYRYGIWAHSYGGPSGQSELRGNDFVVTLGSGFGGSIAGHTGSIGTTNEQAATYGHEMGHLLNLQHGGPKYLISAPGTTLADSSINCKPNYFSIMSYSRQLDTYLGANWVLKYSPGGHSSLTELGGLVESAANILGGTASETAVYGSPVVSPTAPTHAAPDHTFHTAAGNAGSIDWDDSGGSSGPVTADVNNFGIRGCGATTPGTAYNDYDDRTNFDFNFRQGPSGQFDGITILHSDADDTIRWQTILASGTYDGLNAPIPGTKGTRGSNVPIKLDITIVGNTPVDVPQGHGEVWVSFGSKAGPYTKIKNSLTGGFDFVWNPATHQLNFNWKTNKNDPVSPAFIRVFLTDPKGGFIGGLGANPATIPGQGFLKDLISPFDLPAGERDFATAKITLK